VIAPPGSIPKTSSGKIRRNTTRELYEQNRLSRGRASAAWQWTRLLLINAKWHVRRVFALTFTAAFTLYCWLLGAVGLLLLRVLLPFAGKGVRGGAIVRAWCRTMFRMSTFPVEFVGEAGIRDLEGAVYVANHASYMDALLLRAVLPARVKLAAKGALSSYPVIGPVIAASNVISVTRGRESSADELRRVVREGGSFAIFPEGTFMRAPGLLPFRLGAFRAAVDAGRPVVPIALSNTRRSWPDETWLIRRVPLKVVIGEPLYPAGTGWTEMVRLRDLARDFLAHETGEPAFRYHTSDSQSRASGDV
jgi:1-acyl-sn-glycerol-3-phosphate acyltransferase